MKILVTGGAGFVGSHLCGRLLLDGHDVLCMDDLSTGNVANVAHLTAVRGSVFSFVQYDIKNRVYWDDGKLDRIYNLACPASPKHYQRDPVSTTMTNVLGMKNMLDLARETGARVLQASTSEVYGDAIEHPQKEDYCGNVSPIGPRACYDEGKRCAESLSFDYQRKYGLEVRVARIFNTYGPRMDAEDGRVIPNFINQALRGEPLTIHGSGFQTRSFCYVDDLVDGLVMLMESDVGQPVNLGNPHEVNVYGLAQLIVGLVGGNPGIKTLPMPQDDPKQRCPDIGRAKRMGWSPKTYLRDGLKETISYFQAKRLIAA